MFAQPGIRCFFYHSAIAISVVFCSGGVCVYYGMVQKLEWRLCDLHVRIINISFTTQVELLKKGGSDKPQQLACESIIIL